MATSPYELDRHDVEAELVTPSTPSFTTRRLNSTTFVVVEDDEYDEHPFIYVKLHRRVPVCIVTDTGCDQPAKRAEYKDENYFTHLRNYIEAWPVASNNNAPLNPAGTRPYIVLCTHSHYDHIGGIAQFARGGTTDIVASAAGRDFVETGLPAHSRFALLGRPTPYYRVTHWAQSFERLAWPLPSLAYPLRRRGELDLGITVLATPGHTPDALAWFDHGERHLYVGDSFYEEGADGMAIVWPAEGNWIEWAFSMQKLLRLVRSENGAVGAARGGWEVVPSRVKVGCGHQTASVDGEEILQDVERQFWRVVRGETPVVQTTMVQGEATDTWRDSGKDVRFSFQAPRRLYEDARRFFKDGKLP